MPTDLLYLLTLETSHTYPVCYSCARYGRARKRNKSFMNALANVTKLLGMRSQTKQNCYDHAGKCNKTVMVKLTLKHKDKMESMKSK